MLLLFIHCLIYLIMPFESNKFDFTKNQWIRNFTFTHKQNILNGLLLDRISKMRFSSLEGLLLTVVRFVNNHFFNKRKMKKIILAISLLGWMTGVVAQETMTLDEVKSKYGQFIVAFEKQGFDDRTYVDKKVVVPEEDTVLAKFVEKNLAFIELLKTNYTTVTSDEFAGIKDAAVLQEKYIAALQKDALFNQYFLPFICHFYKSEGFEITGFDAKKATFTLDEFMDVIVKYFEVTSVDSRGNFKTRIGISEDGLVSTLDKRHPLLEVYCLHIIKAHQYKAYQSMEKGKRVMKNLQLGLNEDDKLKRAQGVLYAMVSQDEAFRTVVLDDYESKKEALPFVLSTE